MTIHGIPALLARPGAFTLLRLLFMLGGVLLLGMLVARAAVDVPFTDEVHFGYLYRPTALGEAPALRDLFAAHNGHPYLIMKSLLAATLLWEWPWSWLMYAQIPLLAATFWVASAHSRANNLLSVVALFGLALVILTPRQWENLYWAMQIAFPLALLFSVAAFHLAARYTASGTLRTLVGAVACAGLATLSSGAGVFAALLTGLTLAAAAWTTKRPPAHLLLAVAGTALSLLAYIASLRLGPIRAIGDTPIPPLLAFDHVARMLGHSIADFGQANPLGIAAGTVVAVLLAWCLQCTIGAWRQFTFELLCLAFGAILVAGVTYARLRAGIYQPDASRYVPLVMPFAIGSLLILVRTGRAALALAMVGALSVGYAVSFRAEWGITPYRARALEEMRETFCATGRLADVTLSREDILAMQVHFCDGRATTPAS